MDVREEGEVQIMNINFAEEDPIATLRIEEAETSALFSNPSKRETEEYISVRFG